MAFGVAFGAAFPLAVREVPALAIAGVGFHGNPFLPVSSGGQLRAMDALRERYDKTVRALPGLASLLLEPELRYEIRLADEESPATGYFEVFLGQRVSLEAPVPFELGVKLLPAATCAVVTLRGSEVESDWERWLEAEWMPGTAYLRAGTYAVQVYGGGSAVEAWVPLRGRA